MLNFGSAGGLRRLAGGLLLKYTQVLALSTTYQAGIVLWVAYGRGKILRWANPLFYRLPQLDRLRPPVTLVEFG
jgi:hypothetical protein